MRHRFRESEGRQDMNAPEKYASVWDAIEDTSTGCKPEIARGTDAEDRGTSETARLDANSCQPLRCGHRRGSHSLRGRVSRFSLDALVNIATALGCRVRFDLEAA